MWAGRVGERRQEKGLGATGGRAGPTRARPPRHQKSADLDVLSGSSSGDESSSTEEEGSSNAQRYSLRHIPAFVGSTSGDDEEEWEEGRAKHVRCKRGTLPPAKPLKPTPHDGSGGGTSNPSPQSTDTAQVSSSSFGTVVAGGSEGRDSRSASQDQAATPLTNWVDDSAGWELVRQKNLCCMYVMGTIVCWCLVWFVGCALQIGVSKAVWLLQTGEGVCSLSYFRVVHV